jgi:uncharacterized membrane protein SpoIIM required for sporulation
MTAATDQALRSWLERRISVWQRLAALAGRLTRTRAADASEAIEMAEGYRTVARDLALARRVMPESRTRAALETLYARLHAGLHRPPHRSRSDLRRLLRDDVPQVMRELRPHLMWVTLLFVLSGAAGAWLVHTYPELIGLIASEEMIQHVEDGELWTDQLLNVMPSSVLSIEILANNITVTLFAFAAGLFFGLGTFYLIALNGLMLGAVFAFTAQHDLGMRLFNFVIAHGLVELSVICIAGAAGAALGEALVRPGERTRREAFQTASTRIGKLLVPCALLLVGCGFIEGYVSPDPSFPLLSRVVIGVGYWLIMIATLRGDLFGRGRQTRRSRLSLA